MSEESNTPKLRSLFALVVGINQYHSVKPLAGCVGDAQAMISYLEDPLVGDQFEVQLATLFDAEATKAAIVQGFRDHLGQAKSGDVALFFFAGHGSREQTTVPAFRHAELDGHIGNIVCVDSVLPGLFDPEATEKTCLADKELRYLIHKLSNKGAEVLTIFDCCHSGGNTRDVVADDSLPANARQVTRVAHTARVWEEFIFHEEVTEGALTDPESMSALLPEGQHIQMAACRDVELAWEFKGRGAFTHTLLETLRIHQGRIRYHELYSRVKNRMKAKGRQAQTPQIYVQTDDPADRYRLFLTNETDDQPAYASVTFNADMNHWRINLGALHGIPIDPASSAVEVSIYPKDKPENQVPARITEVYAGYAVVDPSTLLWEPQGLYRAKVSGLAFKPLAIHVAGDSAGARLAEDGLAQHLEEAEVKLLELVPGEENADYVLRAENGLWITTRPGFAKPLVKPISYQDDAGQLQPAKAGIAYADFVQMAKWTFLRDLEHRPDFPEPAPVDRDLGAGRYPVELKIFRRVFDEEGKEVEREHDHRKGSVTIDMTHDQDTGGPFTKDTKKPRALLRMELINHSEQELYCTLFYLSQEFGVEYPFFEQAELPLAPGQAVKSRKMRSGDYLPFRIPPHIRDDNWDGLHEHLKLVVSEEPFGAELLKMEGLPEPGARKSGTRGAFDAEEAEETVLPSYWSTYTVELFTMNPYFRAEESAD